MHTGKPQPHLHSSMIPQFVDPLPLPTLIRGRSAVTLTMDEFRSPMLSTGFRGANRDYQGTWMWGYRGPEERTGTAAGPHCGPVILARRGQPLSVRYINRLGSTASTNLRFWSEATDDTFHWADPLGTRAMRPKSLDHMASSAMLPGRDVHYAGPIPAVPHLHGGIVPASIDGGPDAWFTSDGRYHGPKYHTLTGTATRANQRNEATYRYPNVQEAAPLWFHDHVLGITRLNVYAGLFGVYLLEDPGMSLPPNLPSAAEAVPLVLRDASFDVDGQLFFNSEGVNPEHPSWVPEFIGDAIIVNGKTWPFHKVERRRYRFMILNGSNARSFELSLIDPVTKAAGPPIWVIGNDGGYLDAPVRVGSGGSPKDEKELLVMPAERYEVIIDFGDPDFLRRNPNFSGKLLLRNTAGSPYPGGDPVFGTTTGRVMTFMVGRDAVVDNSYDPTTDGPLRAADQRIVRLTDPATGALAAGVKPRVTRQLTLNEVMGEGGPLEVLLNNSHFMAKVSEHAAEGGTEIWEIVNLTEDAHPIHIHLANFQVLNAQAFDKEAYEEVYEKAFRHDYRPGAGPPLGYYQGNRRALGGNPDVAPYLRGPVLPPWAHAAGWKDTLLVRPGMVTRFAVRFAPTETRADETGGHYPFDPADGSYMWHCHILDHEDNDMMRSFTIAKATKPRRLRKGRDY